MARIAVTVTSDFEDSELTYPAEALEAAGHEVVIIGEKAGEEIHGKRGKSKTAVAGTPEQRDPTDFDALLIPGGYSPDKLRTDPHMVSFVQEFFRSNKPVAAVCHGPQLLIEAGVVDGRTMTSWPSVKTDLKNAGATWVDREVVTDGNLTTSRKPDDLPAFTERFMQQIDGA
ncbi:MAG: type 1 glutamine amidotransferase [Myxococcales bacterium]|nr:type 1 glutamine amidotransferase [Myxococcales bacterium]MCB9575552.1 type 1 glutamine amidotransferase [Polyangiaceae bacterium]